MRYESDVISKNIIKKQKIKKILVIFLYIMLIPLILFSLLLMLLELGDSYGLPSSFNIELYTITSDSMKPKLNINDLVLVKKGYTNEDYKVGNIITFIKDGEVITHRISKIVLSDFRNSYITKGDNNDTVDDYIVQFDMISGKVIYTFPRTGFIMNLLQNKVFFVLCIILLFIIILYDIRQKKKIIERKIARERYEKKSDFYF